MWMLGLELEEEWGGEEDVALAGVDVPGVPGADEDGELTSDLIRLNIFGRPGGVRREEVSGRRKRKKTAAVASYLVGRRKGREGRQTPSYPFWHGEGSSSTGHS